MVPDLSSRVGRYHATLGAWAPLLVVAEDACAALGTALSWKTVAVSGDVSDEYLSLLAGTPDTPEGRALQQLLDSLETASELLDPKSGRPRTRR